MFFGFVSLLLFVGAVCTSAIVHIHALLADAAIDADCHRSVLVVVGGGGVIIQGNTKKRLL